MIKFKDILIESIETKLLSKYPLKSLHIIEDTNTIILSTVIFDKENQNQGNGTNLMNDLCNYADRLNKEIRLTPAIKDLHHGTTSQTRLIKFYQRFGFKLNKGRNKDFSHSYLMVRTPQ
jgi:GNAT superfamily N-acetyltransferase